MTTTNSRKRTPKPKPLVIAEESTVIHRPDAPQQVVDNKNTFRAWVDNKLTEWSVAFQYVFTVKK
jgi:hypothetical protein